MTVLTGETLARLNADVSLPRYDRRHVATGIVHIGVGNFHRLPQAMYIDTLMNSGAAMDWASAVSAYRAVFGELADDTRFTRVYSSILASLHERGVRRTLADLDHCAGHWAAPCMADRNPAGRERKSP